MRVLAWHVHGSWMTSFVQGRHEYLLPLVADRGPDGRGRADTWEWPQSALEVTPEALRDEPVDVVVLQRPHELELAERWLGRKPGIDVPAVYVEHNTPRGPSVETRHPLADRTDIPVVHVTHFNRTAWDSGDAPTLVIEHGIPDPGYGYRGDDESLAVVVNEPVRRWRVAGTDLLLDVARQLPVEVYGMGMPALLEAAETAGVTLLAGRVHENVPQHRMHAELGRHRAYLHPYRWTSLGLALLEAMMIGLPVLALATTEAPRAVPPGAGVLSCDPAELVAAARRWLADPDEARETGLAGRRHALARYALPRFLDDWDRLLEGVVR
ncbi:MAG: glycosyltransferase family 4 protein [Actinomycetes bacterium]